MSRRVLITAPYFQPVVPQFAAVFAQYDIDPVVIPTPERLSATELLPWVGDIEGAICGDDAYTEEVLARAPRLRVIAKWGTGIDSIDLEACQRQGIAVCNTPDAFSDPVADTTVGYILALTRGLVAISTDMKAGTWRKRPTPSLREGTVGIVGVGHIGQAVARRLRPFGGRILGTDPVRPPAAFLEATSLELVPLPALLAASDVVTLHCDLNPTSVRLIDEAALARMRRGAVLVNTARGRIVDEAALIQALQRGAVAGAALDVFEREPLPLENPLRAMPHVLLAPHQANSSPRAWARVHQRTVEQLLQHLGRPPVGSMRHAAPS